MELHTESVHGCTDWTQKIVTVTGKMLINVPNSFTPNGDGINETFEPIIFGALVIDFSFTIFDRWGEIVFSTTDHAKAWEGNYKGQKAQSDLYIWKLEVKSKYLVEKEKFMGQVRLMR
jgi:gliding motility-associated-like protein